MKEEFKSSKGCGRARRLILTALLACILCAGACRSLRTEDRPRIMREVPAASLAFRLEPDFDTSNVPVAVITDEPELPLVTIENDFKTNRTDDALLRTVPSPDGQRALALYATGDTPEGEFRVDLYAADGTFLRNVLPENLSGAFPQTVAWSADGGAFAFIGRRSLNAADIPNQPDTTNYVNDNAAPAPSPTAAPIIAPVSAYNTEQIYIADRDGYNLRPLTTREGLIYFDFSWSPDGSALAALATREDEWNARVVEGLTPQGRPRIVLIDGRERLLDDRLTSTVPAWSPDASKVAAAYDADVVIYDAAGEQLTAATLPLRAGLLAASVQFQRVLDAKNAADEASKAANGDAQKTSAKPEPPPAVSSDAPPISFNPVTRLEWVEPQTILAQTAFVRVFRDALPIRKYVRWHVIRLSPQVAVLNHS